MTDSPMTIVELRAENLKKLSAVTIRPDGQLVVLGGNNGAGKTSVLDAITMALGGKATVPAEPIRRGADHAEVVVDLGSIVVKRTFTPGGGGQLVVSNKEGAVFRSPQAMLDELVGSLSFDPLEFARMKPAQQREALVEITGADTLELDVKREELYRERRDVNRDVASLKARLADMPGYDDVPAAEVSISDALAELTRAEEANAKLERDRAAVGDLDERREALRARIERMQVELADLEHQASVLRERLEGAEEVDTTEIKRNIGALQETNDKVRKNLARKEVSDALVEMAGRADLLTNDIRVMDDLKKKLLRDAQMPVPGLGFSEGGVTLNDLPLEQASAAEQLRVSVGIAIAMNPKLRVLLIRDASLLDEVSLRMVAEMAAEAGAQVWLERVGSDQHTTVLIEDGAVISSGTMVDDLKQAVRDANIEPGDLVG